VNIEEEDQLVGNRTKDGIYSVKSGYYSLKEWDRNRNDDPSNHFSNMKLWDKVWKLISVILPLFSIALIDLFRKKSIIKPPILIQISFILVKCATKLLCLVFIQLYRFKTMITPMRSKGRQTHVGELYQNLIKTSRDDHNLLSMYGEVKACISKGF